MPAADGARYQPSADPQQADGGGEQSTLLGTAAAAVMRVGAAAVVAPAAAAVTVTSALGFGAPEENGNAGAADGGGLFGAPAENGHPGGSAAQVRAGHCCKLGSWVHLGAGWGCAHVAMPLQMRCFSCSPLCILYFAQTLGARATSARQVIPLCVCAIWHAFAFFAKPMWSDKHSPQLQKCANRTSCTGAVPVQNASSCYLEQSFQSSCAQAGGRGCWSARKVPPRWQRCAAPCVSAWLSWSKRRKETVTALGTPRACIMQASVGAGREHPKVAAVRAAVRERLAKQEADEASSKDALMQKAASYLETFYQARTRLVRVGHAPWTMSSAEGLNRVKLVHTAMECQHSTRAVDKTVESR